MSAWQAQAPNRLAYQIVKGYSAVIVGKHRWDKPPNGRWKRSPQQPITQPTPPWTTATNAYVLGATKVRGRPAVKVSFYDPETPGWFTVVLERNTLRTLDLRMITTAHFMHETYGQFDAAPEIRAPTCHEVTARLDVDQIEARRRFADRKDVVCFEHLRVERELLRIGIVGHDATLADSRPTLPVVLEDPSGPSLRLVRFFQLGPVVRIRHTRLPPDLWNLRIPSAAR